MLNVQVGTFEEEEEEVVCVLRGSMKGELLRRNQGALRRTDRGKRKKMARKRRERERA